MANNTRVQNLTRNYSLKHKQALRAVENCACAWVEFGVSVRDLSLAESIVKRNEQARTREPLAFAELPSLIYRPSERGAALTRAGYEQVRAANQFAAMPA